MPSGGAAVKLENVREGILFARRIYVPRVLGTLLCGLIIAVTAYEKMSLVECVLLALNGFIWAHVAFYLSRKSSNPFKMEKINFLADSLFCGFWIAVMHVKPLPSVAIFSMVAMNNVAIGGPKFFFKSLGFKCLGFAVVFLFSGVDYRLDISAVSEVLLCLPLVGIYPIVLGISFYNLAAELKNSKVLLRQLSCTDSLTGLLNRRYWCELVSGHIARQKFMGSAVLVMVDIDRFKFVNDAYGHHAGDKALCILADALRSKLRGVDCICRFGGDEFCIFLTDISVKESAARMVEVSKIFEAEVEKAFPASNATLSAGVMPWNSSIVDVDSWIALADKNLYNAKRNGRNQVFIDLSE